MTKSSVFHPQQRGMVLVTALLLLIVVTILAVGMFRSFGLDERIAGNVREKNRALNAAESAEQAAEYWLVNNASTGVACTGFTTMPTGQICTNALTASAVTQLPWTAGVNYVPTNMSVTSTAPGQNTFYDKPRFYITYLGLTPSGLAKIYQIDAAAYGAAPDTAAVVEATYAVSTSVSCLGGCGQ
jgi:type IV pilus assembly protein PilX